MSPSMSPALMRRRRGGSSPFTPLDLFASSEEGAWYDLSDATQLKQLSDGSTDVIATDPVGYLLDKRLGSRTLTQATAGNRATFADPGLTFDGTSDLLRASGNTTGSSPPVYVGAANVPDVLNTPTTGDGFTITGLCRAPDDTWWAGNDGRWVGTPGQNASLVHMSADFSTVLDEIQLVGKYSGITSVQGVAYDTSDDTLWFVDIANDAIRHIETDGTVIAGDEIAVATGTPNGLAYNPGSDTLFVSTDAPSLEERSCTDGTVSQTAVQSAEGLYYDATYDLLYISKGTNGPPGSISIRRASDLSSFKTFGGSLTNATAVEHMSLDGNRVFVAHDGLYHGQEPQLNQVQEYRLEPVFFKKLTFWLAGSLGVSASTMGYLNGGRTGGPASSIGWGVYSTATTTLRVIINSAAATSPNRVILDYTGQDFSTPKYLIGHIDTTAKTFDLWINGTKQTQQAISAVGDFIEHEAFTMGAVGNDKGACTLLNAGYRIAEDWSDEEAASLNGYLAALVA